MYTFFSGNWPLPQKSRWGCRQIRWDLAKSAPCFQQQSKRKIWRRSQKRDQKITKATRSNQNLDRICRNQRQIRFVRKTEAHWGGKNVTNHYFFLSNYKPVENILLGDCMIIDNSRNFPQFQSRYFQYPM